MEPASKAPRDLPPGGKLNVTREQQVARRRHVQQQVDGRHQTGIQSRELAEMARTLQTLQRRSVAAILGSGLLVVAAVLYALEAGGPRLLGVPLSAWVAGLGGLWAILAALPRK